LRTIVWLAVLAWTAFAGAATVRPAAAQSPAIDCALVGVDQVSALAGTPVLPADETSAGSGICFFAARAASQDAVVSYAIVRPQTLPQRTAYFTAQSRLCAGVSPGAPRAALCATYVQLAAAHGIDGYFAARTKGDDAQPVAGLGDRAVSNSGGLFVQRGNLVLEVVVRRHDELELDAATKLANLLLARIPAAQTP
jgi:hypothetical protein